MGRAGRDKLLLMLGRARLQHESAGAGPPRGSDLQKIANQ